MVNYKKQFEYLKPFIIEEIITEFGEKNRKIIEDRINETVFVFSSTPEEDYKWMITTKEKLSNLDKLKIQTRFLNFMKVKQKKKKLLIPTLKQMIEYYFNIIIPEELINDVISLFTRGDFKNSWIDFLSQENKNLINDNNTPSNIKKSLLKKQKQALCKFQEIGIDMSTINQENIEEFLQKRNLVKETFYRQILESNTPYINNLRKTMNLTDAFCLYNVSFHKSTHFGRFNIDGNCTKYIYYPINRKKLAKEEGLDVDLIHEIIHSIQKQPLPDFINEINVQNHAMNIAERLHKKGIYIFDNPKNCKVRDTCAYEAFLPFIDSFLKEQDSILSEALLEGDYSYLTEIYGKDWLSFTSTLQNWWQQLFEYMNVSDEFDMVIDNTNMEIYIENMKEYYRKNNKIKNY